MPKTVCPFCAGPLYEHDVSRQVDGQRYHIDCVIRLLKDKNHEQTKALRAINDIRNSIIALATMNWSAHIYPLVAALNEAGYESDDYEEAKAKAQTLIDQRDRAFKMVEIAETALEKITDKNIYVKPGTHISTSMRIFAEEAIDEMKKHEVTGRKEA